LDKAHQTLIAKLKEHSRLGSADIATIRSLSCEVRQLAADEDMIRQGDDPKVSALVLHGIVARYHLLRDGRRQYLSFHLTGDLPDAQALFINRMDHAVCAMGPASVALIPHKDIIRAFSTRPEVGFAIWRETLIDAAIFREAITNNSARTTLARMAHLFCELFYRAKASGLTRGDKFSLPISLAQLGETLSMSIATVNRTLAQLRARRVMDFRTGSLQVGNWEDLVQIAQFDPAYLHLKKPIPL
jgi:CRP-like cAMP-binding protein